MRFTKEEVRTVAPSIFQCKCGDGYLFINNHRFFCETCGDEWALLTHKEIVARYGE